MSQINRSPLGLLSFLGIKNGGRNPDTLGSQLAPVWDLSQIYGSTNSETSATTVAVAALGYTNYFVVPNSEVWMIESFGLISSTLGAGVTFQAALAWSDQSGLNTVLLEDPAPAQTVGARFGIALKRRYVVTPGSSIGILTTQLVAGPVNVYGAVRFARMPM